LYEIKLNVKHAEMLHLNIIDTSLQYLADIEDHLNVTIQQVSSDIKVPLNEFDGKVMYGEKKMAMGE